MKTNSQATQQESAQDVIDQRLRLYLLGLGTPAAETERVVARVGEAIASGQPGPTSLADALGRAMAMLHVQLAGDDPQRGGSIVTRSALARLRLGYGGGLDRQPQSRPSSRAMRSFPTPHRISMVPERRGRTRGPTGALLRGRSAY
jgi:hypothetical protein